MKHGGSIRSGCRRVCPGRVQLSGGAHVTVEYSKQERSVAVVVGLLQLLHNVGEPA